MIQLWFLFVVVVGGWLLVPEVGVYDGNDGPKYPIVTLWVFESACFGRASRKNTNTSLKSMMS